MRTELESAPVNPQTINLDLLAAIQKAIQISRDCFLDVKKTCEHKSTYTDRIKSAATDIEVCRDCGMSRAICKDIESSEWQMVDIEAEKKRCPECFDDPEGKKTCSHCNPKPAIDPGAEKAKIKKTSSQYFGVSFKKKAGKWLAQINRGSKFWYGGQYKIEEDAAIAVQDRLGNPAEASRIRAIRDKKYPAICPQLKQPEYLKPKWRPTKISSVAIAKPKPIAKQPALTAAEKATSKEIDKFKGEYTWQWSCKGCGNIVQETKHRCRKCNGGTFEKIKVMDNPQKELDRSEGRHH
jgi:hypothetical protein